MTLGPLQLSEETARLPPRLLVSVRNVDEARAALDGGAAILDLKEPRHGPLGRVSLHVGKEVMAFLSGPSSADGSPRTGDSLRHRVTLSAALGEVHDEDRPRNWKPVPGISLYKLGLSRCAGNGRWKSALDGWLEWLKVSGPGPSLVAVAYADDSIARAPQPREVLEYAIGRRLPYFLMDTFDKRQGSLRAWRSDGELKALVDIAHRGGVRVALAGCLRAEDFEALAPLGPDVLAVRSAACQGGDRLQQVDAIRVASLVAKLNRSRPRTPHLSW